MKQKIKSLIKYFAILFVLILPFSTQAQNNAVQQGLQDPSLKSSFGSTGLLGANTVTELIVKIIKLMLLFAGIIAVMFIIIGGYYYITSAGNEETAEKGRKTLVNAIIGVVIVTLSYAIVNVISRQLA